MQRRMCGIPLSLSMIHNEEEVCVLQTEWPCVCVCVCGRWKEDVYWCGGARRNTHTHTGQQFAQSQVSFSSVNVLKVNFQEQGLGGSFLLICSP